MKRDTIIALGIAGLLIIAGAWMLAIAPGKPRLVAAAHYLCNEGKTIDASFFEGKGKPPAGPDMPPTPGGSAQVILSDGRTMTLAQTLSADGVRYANADESFVFWSKGNGALVLENDIEKSFKACVAVAGETDGLSNVYHGASYTLRYPAGYEVNAAYTYTNLGPKKTIAGVSFSMPTTTRAGTNLASDTRVSVETLPEVRDCSAALFLEQAKATTLTEGGIEYSYATMNDAGAGNRYEETVYAFPGTNPCVAVRYFVHYSAIENYPEGVVKAFDKTALLKDFDAMRHSFIIAP